MRLTCPRCREPIDATWDHCHHCGLTASQLDRLVRVAGLAPTPPSAPPRADASSPGYYDAPVYGKGPVLRSTGYSPGAPPVHDLRRDDTMIDLSDGEARVSLLSTGASVKAPPPPTPPRHRAGTGPTVSTGHKVELALTAALVVAIVVLAVLFLL